MDVIDGSPLRLIIGRPLISARVPDVDVYLHRLLWVDVDVLHECARRVLADRDGGEVEGAVALEKHRNLRTDLSQNNTLVKIQPNSEGSRDPEEKGGVFTLYPSFAGSETEASWEYCFSRYPCFSPTGCDLS